MSTYNIWFYGELTKIILQLSSNTLLICFTDHIAQNEHKVDELELYQCLVPNKLHRCAG